MGVFGLIRDLQICNISVKVQITSNSLTLSSWVTVCILHRSAEKKSLAGVWRAYCGGLESALCVSLVCVFQTACLFNILRYFALVQVVGGEAASEARLWLAIAIFDQL